MSTPPIQPGPLEKPPAKSGLDDYHQVADTVGGVPNLRLKDNVVQTLVVLGAMLLGGLIGSILAWTGVLEWEWYLAAGAGAVAGMILGTLFSGLVLMVLGWVRTFGNKS
ncbi:MAG: hypothetical protein HBSAPP03_17950 [Phycisphaerae bacterium]|nr:MAG: hypothetical protein HBSAPP03_17950 [Phycisphaerae bacterium]